MNRPQVILDRLKAAKGPLSPTELAHATDATEEQIPVYIQHIRSRHGQDTIRTVRLLGYELTEKGREVFA